MPRIPHTPFFPYSYEGLMVYTLIGGGGGGEVPHISLLLMKTMKKCREEHHLPADLKCGTLYPPPPLIMGMYSRTSDELLTRFKRFFLQF